MRTAIVILLLTAGIASAQWSQPQVREWAWMQGVTNDTSGVVVNADDGIESGWDAAWGSKPTLAEVETIDKATATANIAAREQAAQAADPTSSLNAFLRFSTLVQSAMGVTLNSTADLVGKADDMLIAANTRLAELEADMDAASTLAEYKAANKAMASYQADLDRINLFMWAIQVRISAGK